MTAAPGRRLAEATRITSRKAILGGSPCVDGARVPARTIVAEIRSGASDAEILDGYPTLPPDGIEAVRRWAIKNGISIARTAR